MAFGMGVDCQYITKKIHYIYTRNVVVQVNEAGLPGNKLPQVWHFAPLDCFRHVMECYWCSVLFKQRFNYKVYGALKTSILKSFLHFHTILTIKIFVTTCRIPNLSVPI